MPRQVNNYSIRRKIEQEPLWKSKQPRLLSLDIELTERCNNACQHCYINRPMDDLQALSQELSTTEWQTVIHQAAELGALSVRMTGGEPLLRPDFMELYLYTRRLGIRVQLFTNARRIDTTLVDMFGRIPPGEKIEITVYGMTSHSYEAATCTPGSFEEYQQGIELLLERNIPFMVKMALLPPNIAERPTFETWQAGLPWPENPPHFIVNFNLRGRRDSANRNRLIRKLRIPAEDAAQIIISSEATRQELFQFCSHHMGPAGDLLFPCGAGQKGCVDAYGRYQPCMLLRKPGLSYDLHQGTLHEVLTTFFPGLRSMRATNSAYLQRCAVCFLHGLCEQCPAKSWSEYGTLDTPVEHLCELAHSQARLLGLLGAGEHAWEVKNWQERIRKLPTSTNMNEIE